MKVRAQIAMPPKLRWKAQVKAAKLGISLSEYLRRIIATDLGPPKPKADKASRRLRRRVRSK